MQVLYINLHKPFKRSYGIPGSLCSESLLSVKTWTEGTNDMPYKNPYFFRDNWAKSDGVFAEMQIISYSFIMILKHIQIN